MATSTAARPRPTATSVPSVKGHARHGRTQTPSEGNAAALHVPHCRPSEVHSRHGDRRGGPGRPRSLPDAGVHGRLLAGRLRRGRRRGFAGQWRWQVLEDTETRERSHY